MSDKQCPLCDRKHVGPIRLWRRNTQYADHYMNYLKSCVHCIRRDDLDFHYLWAEYYNSQGWYERYDYYERWATSYVKPQPVRYPHAHKRIC